MLSTSEFLRSLSNKGISVSLQDGRLKVVPKELLTDHIRAEIKKYKASLLIALRNCAPVASAWSISRESTKNDRMPVSHNDNSSHTKVRRKGGSVDGAPTAALDWLKKRRSSLLGVGWTDAELFGGNKSSLGIAWLGLWRRTDIEVSLLSTGIIQFYFKGQGVNQTARPKNHISLIGV